MSVQPIEDLPEPSHLHDRLAHAGQRILAAVSGEIGAELPALRLVPTTNWSPRSLSSGEVDALYRPRPRGVVQESFAVELEPACDDVVDYRPTSSEQLPAIGPLLPRITLGMLETMDGLRPVTQVSRWFAPAIIERLNRRNITARRRGLRPRHVTKILKVHTCHPADGVVEASVVVSHAGRVRAIAMRLVGVDGRWLVTVLEMA